MGARTEILVSPGREVNSMVRHSMVRARVIGWSIAALRGRGAAEMPL